MNLAVIIILAVLIVVFLFYSGIAVRHAAQFRYLSRRTVYLTIFYVSATSALLLLTLITALIFILN